MYDICQKFIYIVNSYYFQATKEALLAFTSITKCFDNVFLSSRRLKVVWGEYSVLEAELICLKDLMLHLNWKYFINLTGQVSLTDFKVWC